MCHFLRIVDLTNVREFGHEISVLAKVEVDKTVSWDKYVNKCMDIYKNTEKCQIYQNYLLHISFTCIESHFNASTILIFEKVMTCHIILIKIEWNAKICRISCIMIGLLTHDINFFFSVCDTYFRIFLNNFRICDFSLKSFRITLRSLAWHRNKIVEMIKLQSFVIFVICFISLEFTANIGSVFQSLSESGR